MIPKFGFEVKNHHFFKILNIFDFVQDFWKCWFLKNFENDEISEEKFSMKKNRKFYFSIKNQTFIKMSKTYPKGSFQLCLRCENESSKKKSLFSPEYYIFEASTSWILCTVPSHLSRTSDLSVKTCFFAKQSDLSGSTT